MARILIIDYDQELRTTMSRLLENMGHQVVEASDGRQGINFYYDVPFDLVITDIFMPVKEGYDVIQELKSKFPDVSIIAIIEGTEKNSKISMIMARMLGASYTLSKPFERMEFEESVNQILNQDQE